MVFEYSSNQLHFNTHLECGALPPLSFAFLWIDKIKNKESGGKAPHSKETKASLNAMRSPA